VINRIRQLWVEESGQDVAEYAVMLAVILVIVIGTVRLDRRQRQQRVFASRQQLGE
jgi:Flp pilus assembly pilin Flp